MEKPGIGHTVFFWLKEGTTEEDKKFFEEGLDKLSAIKGAIMYYWGKPAPSRKRDVIEDSYDYAINSFFANLEDEETYQNDPDHHVFIDNHNHIWEKVVVYNNTIS